MSCSSCFVAAPYDSSLYFFSSPLLCTPAGTGRRSETPMALACCCGYLLLLLKPIEHGPEVGDPDGAGLLWQ